MPDAELERHIRYWRSQLEEAKDSLMAHEISVIQYDVKVLLIRKKLRGFGVVV